MPNQSHPRTKEFTLLVKIRGSRVWNEVSNPLWQQPHAESYAAEMLKNWTIEYIEYASCGAVYRVVRRCNADAYRLE